MLGRSGRLCLVGLLLSGCAFVDERPAGPIADVSMPATKVFRNHSMHVVSDFKLGLHWQPIAPDYIAILAVVPKTQRLIAHAGLVLEIDGESFHFSAGMNAAGISQQAFVVRLAVVKRMLAAQRVVVKVQTSEGPLSGEFTVDQAGAAIRGFRETLARIERIRSPN